MGIVKAMFAPLVTILNSFLAFRNAKFYQIEMNYQVCYLEAFLNDRFDFSQRRIYIGNPDDAVPPVYLYQDEEDQPIYLYQDVEANPVYMYQDDEYTGNIALDFIVWVPVDVVFDEAEMRAMIATKLSGKKYAVQTF